MAQVTEMVPPHRMAPRMAVGLEEYQGRLARVRQWMGEADIDLLLITQPEHYNYLSGFDPTSTFYFQVLFVPVGEEPPTLLVNKAEHLLALETTWIEDLQVVWTHDDQIARTVEILRSRNWATGRARIGLNLDSYYLKPRYFLALQAALPQAEFVDVTSALDDLRLVKSPAEIEYLRRAAHVADLGVTAGINAIRAGVLDRDVMAAIQGAVALNGGEFPAYPTLVDARGTLHGTPIGRVLDKGDVIYLEVSGVVRRYHCNISRTVVIGEPSTHVKELYAVVRNALDRCTEAMRPGVPVAEVVRIADECRQGYEQNTWARFGFSMEIAYPPIWIGGLSLMRGDPHVLEAGMVITVEPGLSYSQGATMMLGNNVLVTETGPEILNNVPVELFQR
jgi:Xaa-Pro aminopeptidase